MRLNPAVPPPSDPGDALARRLADLERRVATLERQLSGGATQRIPVVASLPAAGSEGRLVKLSAGGVYIDTGSSWTAL